jgi:predicted metal-dependent hydrolase
MRQNINPIEHGLLQDLLALYQSDLNHPRHQTGDSNASRLNNAKRAFIRAIERYCQIAQMSEFESTGANDATI